MCFDEKSYQEKLLRLWQNKMPKIIGELGIQKVRES